jgi:hypothetical protein
MNWFGTKKVKILNIICSPLKIAIGLYAANPRDVFEIGNFTASRHCITSSTFSR